MTSQRGAVRRQVGNRPMQTPRLSTVALERDVEVWRSGCEALPPSALESPACLGVQHRRNGGRLKYGLITIERGNHEVRVETTAWRMARYRWRLARNARILLSCLACVIAIVWRPVTNINAGPIRRDRRIRLRVEAGPNFIPLLPQLAFFKGLLNAFANPTHIARGCSQQDWTSKTGK